MRVAAGQVGAIDLDRLSLWDENTQSLERRGVDAAAREGERAGASESRCRAEEF
jgi:hypothetical protein